MMRQEDDESSIELIDESWTSKDATCISATDEFGLTLDTSFSATSEPPTHHVQKIILFGARLLVFTVRTSLC